MAISFLNKWVIAILKPYEIISSVATPTCSIVEMFPIPKAVILPQIQPILRTYVLGFGGYSTLISPKILYRIYKMCDGGYPRKALLSVNNSTFSY